MVVPKSLLESIEAAGRRAKQRASVGANPESDAERSLRVVWGWLEGDEVRAVKEALGKAGLTRITLLGPEGVSELALVSGEPGLSLKGEQLHTQGALGERIPASALKWLAGLIERDEIWAQLQLDP
jgi:hypothetical protein